MRLILGSKSPRRKQLLAGLDLRFDVVDIDADETCPPHLQAGDIPLYLSRAKAAAYIDRLLPDDLLITADTIVWRDGQMLGKPHDEEDACRMLRLLSGLTHQVYTGVTLTGADGSMESFLDTTDVTFRCLTDDEIRYYVTHYHPLDKAGAYGIQEWIGYVGCTALSGSYFNVMGLPVEKLWAHLQKNAHLFAHV